MSKLNIKFNNKTYSVDSALLSDATSRLEAHLRSMADAPGVERLEGDGQEFHTMAPSSLSFRSTAPLDELVDVKINGEVVDPSNYTLTEGSTIVTFPIDYLRGLLQGKHEVTVESQNGSASGDFTVVDPDLNEYGFYYNQPYTGYAAALECNVAFFIKDDGTLNLIDLTHGGAIACTYALDGNNTTITSPMGVFTGTITSDGFYCNELAQTFVLADGSIIVADDDYIYTYSEELGGYEVTAIDWRDTSFGAIKTGIYNYDTVALATYAFTDCACLASIIIPDFIKSIGDYAFHNCSSLASIVIPDSVTSIGKYVFEVCNSLNNITFKGTVAQWNAITFGDYWNEGVPATHVHCSDGDVAL